MAPELVIWVYFGTSAGTLEDIVSGRQKGNVKIVQKVLFIVGLVIAVAVIGVLVWVGKRAMRNAIAEEERGLISAGSQASEEEVQETDRLLEAEEEETDFAPQDIENLQHDLMAFPVGSSGRHDNNDSNDSSTRNAHAHPHPLKQFVHSHAMQVEDTHSHPTAATHNNNKNSRFKVIWKDGEKEEVEERKFLEGSEGEASDLVVVGKSFRLTPVVSPLRAHIPFTPSSSFSPSSPAVSESVVVDGENFLSAAASISSSSSLSPTSLSNMTNSTDLTLQLQQHQKQQQQQQQEEPYFQSFESQQQQLKLQQQQQLQQPQFVQL